MIKFIYGKNAKTIAVYKKAGPIKIYQPIV